ncbi:MAG TPA: 2,3-bisphosphoglycerate-dependent phosphoglycerate mutase [Candidatus Saccharibacteria bacterium]|jgi:D-lactate dehydrogenase|nr:2,3-bisphosphoglycerate-dependent phosphoglycerate mutase [Candidatus Saccharibacteria bacterium]
MAKIYIYDATELDKVQLTEKLSWTDHHWEFISDSISVDNIHADAEIISVFVTSSVTREMIEKMPNLRAIACRSTGFNNIDLRATADNNVSVLNVPTYGESTVAEYAFTLLLALVRKLPEMFSEGQTIESQELLTGTDLFQKTIGVIGTGHIGQHTLQIARGFNMRILAYDAFPKEGLDKELGFEYVELEDLLKQSDIVSLHAPYLPETHHLLNEDRIALMKKGAIIVNTARGELIDTIALVTHLENGHLGGAALDVIEGEVFLNQTQEANLLRSHKLTPEMMEHSVEISALRKLPNVIISPHNAFNTREAVGRINDMTAKNIVAYWYGSMPNLVKPPENKNGKLIVSRHAESEWNATGQWSGIRDVHLSEKGFREAGMLGRALRALDIKASIAYCSEQIRTRETLEGILEASQQYDIDVVRSGALNERDYGDYTGKNKWQMKEEIGEEAWEAIRRGWDVTIPNGETLKMVYERVEPYYVNTILPQLREGKNVLLVAHGNSIRALMKYIEKIPEENIGEIEMIFGDLLVYDIDDEGHMLNKQKSHIGSPPPHA